MFLLSVLNLTYGYIILKLKFRLTKLIKVA